MDLEVGTTIKIFVSKQSGLFSMTITLLTFFTAINATVSFAACTLIAAFAKVYTAEAAPEAFNFTCFVVTLFHECGHPNNEVIFNQRHHCIDNCIQDNQLTNVGKPGLIVIIVNTHVY